LAIHQGTIGDKALHGTINLIEKIRQGCSVATIIRGQIGADDLTPDKIKTNVKLAPSLPFDFDFVLVFQPFALTKDLQARAIDHKMNWLTLADRRRIDGRASPLPRGDRVEKSGTATQRSSASRYCASGLGFGAKADRKQHVGLDTS
jgi:hypothetical protein